MRRHGCCEDEDCKSRILKEMRSVGRDDVSICKCDATAAKNSPRHRHHHFPRLTRNLEYSTSISRTISLILMLFKHKMGISRISSFYRMLALLKTSPVASRNATGDTKNSPLWRAVVRVNAKTLELPGPNREPSIFDAVEARATCLEFSTFYARYRTPQDWGTKSCFAKLILR